MMIKHTAPTWADWTFWRRLICCKVGNGDRNWLLGFIACFVVTGCARTDSRQAHPVANRVIVVAPVVNLSGSSEWDPLKVTDVVAAEMQKVPGFSVIPVNRAL